MDLPSLMLSTRDAAVKSDFRLNSVIDWVATITLLATFCVLIIFTTSADDSGGFYEAAAFTLLGVTFLFSYYAPNAGFVNRFSNWICLHLFFPRSRHWAIALGVLFLTLGIWSLWDWMTPT